MDLEVRIRVTNCFQDVYFSRGTESPNPKSWLKKGT